MYDTDEPDRVSHEALQNMLTLLSLAAHRIIRASPALLRPLCHFVFLQRVLSSFFLELPPSPAGEFERDNDFSLGDASGQSTRGDASSGGGGGARASDTDADSRAPGDASAGGESSPQRRRVRGPVSPPENAARVSSTSESQLAEIAQYMADDAFRVRCGGSRV